MVVAKCPGVDAIDAVPFRHLWRSVEQLDVEDLPLRADECSAYLGDLAAYCGPQRWSTTVVTGYLVPMLLVKLFKLLNYA